MNCPSCGSGNWKMLPLVHSEGLVDVETVTSGGTLGMGASTGGIGGAYTRSRASTEGTHQSELSKAAAPPEVAPHPGEKLTQKRQNEMFLILQIVLSVGFVISAFKDGVWYGLAATAFCYFLFKWFWGSSREPDGRYAEYLERYNAELDKHIKTKKAFEDWERTAVCLRCATRFQPVGTDAQSSAEQPLVIRCPGCGTKNRIPSQRAADNPSCGKCGHGLAPS
jgi:hypothetical protein